MTATRMTPLTNATVRIDPAHLIDSSNDTATVVALGDGGTAWVRFPDGVENAFPIDALTVVTTRPAAVASLPATPAKVVLTPNAKRALATADMRDGGYWYLNATWCLMDSATDAGTTELVRLHLVEDMGTGNGYGFRFVLTENGLRMRSYLQHQIILGKLAKQVRAEDIDGEDLADLAAGIDAGEDTGSITGTTIDFQLAFALAASLSDQSAQDLRQDLEQYMGWV